MVEAVAKTTTNGVAGRECTDSSPTVNRFWNGSCMLPSDNALRNERLVDEIRATGLQDERNVNVGLRFGIRSRGP